VPVGDRAFLFIIEAPSNDEADRIVRDMSAWGLLEWKVTSLQSVEVLLTDGPLRELTPAERDAIGQRLLDMVEKGL
jgi:hypothetical protein